MFEEMMPFALGAGALAMVGAFMVFFVILGIAVYVYTALALMTIATKLKHKQPWLAWIPFANISLVLMMGGFHWAWVFLMLVPVLGWIAIMVMSIISMWRIYEKRKYPGWLSLIWIGGILPFIGWLAGIANMIILGFVAWKDQK